MYVVTHHLIITVVHLHLSKISQSLASMLSTPDKAINSEIHVGPCERQASQELSSGVPVINIIRICICALVSDMKQIIIQYNIICSYTQFSQFMEQHAHTTIAYTVHADIIIKNHQCIPICICYTIRCNHACPSTHIILICTSDACIYICMYY